MASSRPERSSETSIGVITGTIVAHSAPRDPEAMTAWRATMPGFGVRQTSKSGLFGTIGTIGTHKITQQGQHKIGKKDIRVLISCLATLSTLRTLDIPRQIGRASCRE